MSNIRNFCIIAHIDHGKSTIADRMIEFCSDVRNMQDQYLDNMDIERERGITIKAQCITLHYKRNDQTYTLNLIDTPGHVDFAYEVSRSLAACDGAILIVDASQGVEAQTLNVCYQAVEHDLEIIPVLNKIDLPQADPESCIESIENIVGIPAQDACLTRSAKTGQGIDQLLDRIIDAIPAAQQHFDGPLQVLIVDSWFDPYVGVISLIRVVKGTLKRNQYIVMAASGERYRAEDIGIFTAAGREKTQQLASGEVGYIIAGIKNIQNAKVGDTIIEASLPDTPPLPGFKQVKPQVFAGLYPIDSTDYPALREALEKLVLNDSALFFEPENSQALGFGFRCGFLGLLHMEIVQERLEREYNIPLINTAPSVIYRLKLKSGEMLEVDSANKLPDPSQIDTFYEPIADVTILTPSEHIGPLLKLCQEKRGIQVRIDYLNNRVGIVYKIPLNEVVLDFFDRVKSLSKGYASLDYALADYEATKMSKLDIMLNQEKVDALTSLVHASQAQSVGRSVALKLKELIPRQMFPIAIQAAVGGTIVARETVSALRKNVTAKCYGGDISRKRKLLDKQKKGKKRMKQIGKVQVPQEAFLAIVKRDEN